MGGPDFFVRNPFNDGVAMLSGMLAWGQNGEYKHTSKHCHQTLDRLGATRMHTRKAHNAPTYDNYYSTVPFGQNPSGLDVAHADNYHDTNYRYRPKPLRNSTLA